MGEKEKCFEKITFFEEKGANKALRLQPDKEKYRCPICGHWHLTTVRNDMDRNKIANLASSRGRQIVKNGKIHYIYKHQGKVFHVVNGFKGKRHVVEKVIEITNENQLPKFLVEKYNLVKCTTLTDFRFL